MTMTFTYKKAPLGRKVCLAIDDQGASFGRSEREPSTRLDWADATAVRYGEITVRGLTSRWLDVFHAGGRLRLPCNTQESDDPTTGDLGTYRSAVVALLEALEVRRPDLQATLGMGNSMNWVYFLMGATAIAAGVALPLAAWLTGQPSSKIMDGLVPSLMLVAMGSLIVRRFVPWRRPHPIRLAELAGMHGGGT